VTKELDPDIAKVYVALAEGEVVLSDPKHRNIQKEKNEICKYRTGQIIEGMEDIAIDSYLNDDEWEEQEAREGRGVRIQRFPLSGQQTINPTSKRGWW